MEIDKIFNESNNDVDAVDNNNIQGQINIIQGSESMNKIDLVDNYGIEDPMSILLSDNTIDDMDGLIQFLRDGKKKMEEIWKISGEEAAIKLINGRRINFRDFKVTAEHYKDINKQPSIENDMGVLGALADKISINLLSDFNELMRNATKKDASMDVDFYSFGFIRRVANVWDQVKDKL